ncbi:MAG: hypothetical protein F6K38_32450 [Moorea sp. SIO3B2]|nr:hypothetical protein [Moorena sp. SIO4E2]NEP35959.1 hypothetical protein [Moorena sp. SIO3B2]NEQ08662.1 hypothetical protein [Moorena sp. SIO4E2]
MAYGHATRTTTNRCVNPARQNLRKQRYGGARRNQVKQGSNGLDKALLNK